MSSQKNEEQCGRQGSRRQPIKIITRNSKRKRQCLRVASVTTIKSTSAIPRTSSDAIVRISHVTIGTKRSRNAYDDGVPSILTKSNDRKTSRISTTSTTSTCSQSTHVKEMSKMDAFEMEMETGLPIDVPCDIILAMRSLCQRYSYATCDCPIIFSPSDQDRHQEGPIKFVLKPMINLALQTTIIPTDPDSSSIARPDKQKDKTEQLASSISSTDFYQEINHLCTLNQIKVLQLQGLNGEEDEAVMEMKDYKMAIQRALWNLKGINDNSANATNRNSTSTCSKGGSNSNLDKKVVALFLGCLEKSILYSGTTMSPKISMNSTAHAYRNVFQKTYVMGQDLKRVLKLQNCKKSDDDYLISNSEEEWIDALVRYELLLPRTLGLNTNSNVNSNTETGVLSESSYWFVLPKLGQAAARVEEGRRRMILRLKRAPNRELKRKALEVKKGSSLDSVMMMGPFHVRDLLARGVVRLKNTANGQFVKLND